MRTSSSRCEPAPSLDQVAGALGLDLGELDLALLLDDGRLGDRQLLLRGGDARLGLGQLRLQRDGVQLHQHLTRLDERAFVDEDLLDPQRLLGRDVDQLRLEPAVARDDPLRQRGLLRLPVLEADERDHHDGDRRDDPLERPLRDLLGHGRLPSASPWRLRLVPARAAPTTCRPSRSAPSSPAACCSGTTGWPWRTSQPPPSALYSAIRLVATDERVCARLFCCCRSERCASSTRW